MTTTIKRLPYRTPTAERVVISDWVLIRNSEARSLGLILPEWDPAVSIDAACSVQVDVPGVLADCCLGGGACLRVAAVWRCPGTMLRGCGETRDLPVDNPSYQVQLALHIDGINLAESVELSVVLILVNSGLGEYKPFIPRLVGSILAQSKPHAVLLEGVGPRFPIEVIDFANTYYAIDGGWALYWDPDNLHQTVLGDVRLFINARHERIRRAVSEDRPEDFDIREAIRYDIARMLIYGALGNNEFIERPDNFAPGSVGAAVRSMLRLYFPQADILELRENSRQPQVFDHNLQGKFRIFWPEL